MTAYEPVVNLKLERIDKRIHAIQNRVNEKLKENKSGQLNNLKNLLDSLKKNKRNILEYQHDFTNRFQNNAESK